MNWAVFSRITFLFTLLRERLLGDGRSQRSNSLSNQNFQAKLTLQITKDPVLDRSTGHGFTLTTREPLLVRDIAAGMWRSFRAVCMPLCVSVDFVSFFPLQMASFCHCKLLAAGWSYTFWFCLTQTHTITISLSWHLSSKALCQRGHRNNKATCSPTLNPITFH